MSAVNPCIQKAYENLSQLHLLINFDYDDHVKLNDHDLNALTAIQKEIKFIQSKC